MKGAVQGVPPADRSSHQRVLVQQSVFGDEVFSPAALIAKISHLLPSSSLSW
jgi:hypothetical protein